MIDPNTDPLQASDKAFHFHKDHLRPVRDITAEILLPVRQ